MKKALLALAATTMFAAPALADGYNNSTYSNQSQSQTTARVAPPVYSNTTTETGSQMSHLTGAYVGAYGGYSWTDLDTDVAGFDADVNGGDYGLFVGYKVDQLFENNIGINGAIEFFYGWSNADDTIAGVDFEKDHEWGINFRPGLSFLNTDAFGTAVNPYGILGYRRTNYEVSGGAVGGDEDYNGFDLGIGTEVVAWGDVGMRLDYTHTFYEDKGGVDPDEDDVRVGLAYHF